MYICAGIYNGTKRVLLMRRRYGLVISLENYVVVFTILFAIIIEMKWKHAFIDNQIISRFLLNTHFCYDIRKGAMITAGYVSGEIDTKLICIRRQGREAAFVTVMT